MGKRVSLGGFEKKQ